MNTKTKDPDDLLQDINKSIMLKGLLIATAIHAVIILGTSFGLYRDWGTYGFLARPSTIGREKQREQRAKVEAEQQAMADQRATERAEEAKAAAASKSPSRAATPADMDTAPQGAATSPLDGEVLPPATDFSLDGFGI